MTSVFNSLLSYLLLVLVIVVLGGGAIALGIFLRLRKNEKEQAEEYAKQMSVNMEENNET